MLLVRYAIEVAKEAAVVAGNGGEMPMPRIKDWIEAGLSSGKPLLASRCSVSEA